LHHYCVIWSKTEQGTDELPSRLERLIHNRLTFEPDEVVLHRLGARTVVLSASANQEALGVDTPCHLSEDQACIVAGLPTFERFPDHAPSSSMRPAAWLSELLDRSNPQSLYLDLGGTYSAVKATSTTVTGFAAFSGYDSLFYLDNELYAAVGNRPDLVAAMQFQGAYSQTNPEALSWLLSTTMILGYETPWKEVRRLPTGHLVRIDKGVVSVRPFTTNSHTPPDDGDLSEFYGMAIDGLVDRYRWYLSTGARIQAHLTGGKDSRTNLALLLATDAVDRLDRILTIGSEENGDVIIARQIAESVGLDRHVVEPGSKAAVDEVAWDDYQRWFQYSPWKFGLYLTPYDGREWISPVASPIVTFMGGGGEVVRQKNIVLDARVDDLDTIVNRFTNWYYRHDALGLLSPEAVSWQRDFIRKEVAGMVNGGIVNLQQRFYVEHRMANWGNAHFRAASNHSLAGLLDINLARIMHTRPDMGDDLPYEIMTRCAPGLREFQFVNDAWGGPTEVRAQADGVLRPKLDSPTAANFPWQFALYRGWRNTLIGEALRHVSLWEGIVPPEQLHALLDKPVEPFGSAHVKMLFGLVAVTNHLRGNLRPERDFIGKTAPPRVRGNLDSLARRWFEHRPIPPQLSEVESSADGSNGAAKRTDEATSVEQITAELTSAKREQRRLVRKIEKRDQRLNQMREDIRLARVAARRIQRSRSWRVAQLINRASAIVRRRRAG